MAKDHITKLRELGASVYHKVDATKMKQNSIFLYRKFDVIIYNFPHAGFRKRTDSEINVIRMHKRLVKGFFENAIKMLSAEGDVHVTHKDERIYKTWNIAGSAFSAAGLDLREQKNLFNYANYKLFTI
ncbi:hypothetical protein Hanom_Chr13g01200481 [Helianthus anomalus]